MTGVEITVRGSHSAEERPERGIVHAWIGLEGPKPEPVHQGVAATHAALTDAVRQMHDPDSGPVIRWWSGQLRSWASRPWNQDGRRLPLIHRTEVDLHVEFNDFARLGEWLAESAAVEGFSVRYVEWTLTDKRRHELMARVRAGAVHDARAKAQAYADALDLGPVRVTSLADAGMLGRPEPVSRMSLAAAPPAESAAVELTPADIEIEVEVDARFTVDSPAAGTVGG